LGLNELLKPFSVAINHN